MWVVEVLTPTTLPSELTAAPIVPVAGSRNDAAEFGPSLTALLVVPLDSGGVLVRMSLMSDFENEMGSPQARPLPTTDSSRAQDARKKRERRALRVALAFGWRFFVIVIAPSKRRIDRTGSFQRAERRPLARACRAVLAAALLLPELQQMLQPRVALQLGTLGGESLALHVRFRELR
jgi:hypothetical protein